MNFQYQTKFLYRHSSNTTKIDTLSSQNQSKSKKNLKAQYNASKWDGAENKTQKFGMSRVKNKYQIKKVKMTSEGIRNLLKSLHKRYWDENTDAYVPYQNFTDRLIEMHVISNDESQLFSLGKDKAVVIKPNNLDLLICRRKSKYFWFIII